MSTLRNVEAALVEVLAMVREMISEGTKAEPEQASPPEATTDAQGGEAAAD